MSIVATLTLGATAYDISDHIIRHSIEIDEYLFNEGDLRPNTNKLTFTLARSCPYIDELFAWTDDALITIVSDSVVAFTGYLTDNYTAQINNHGMGHFELSAEDPGIKLLKRAWESTDGLVTNFSGFKVCDPADTTHSFIHTVATLAGVTLATSLPTISSLLYFAVQDKDKKEYWTVLEKVLFDFQYVFYFTAEGKLALFSIASLTGTPSQVVRSDATILQESLGDPGIEIKKRLIQYKEVVVSFSEAETLTSAVVFRDTTNQGATDCDITIAGGGYYPESADASTYAYIDYFLEDGRDILSVASITADFSYDAGITYELTHLGKSAQIRFHNPTGVALHIRKLKITGTSVIAKRAASKITSKDAGGKKLEYEADFLSAVADASSLANCLRYVYANSGSMYTFRAYHGTLYPADDLYPSDTLYPLGDLIELGQLISLQDPVWTGLDVDCAVYRKKYRPGKAGATFDAIGIGTITLADPVVRTPTASVDTRPIVGLYPTEKALATTSDTVDFDGQYGVYGGQRYIGTKPTTWTLDDAGQTVDDVAALVPIYEPAYLGAHLDAEPSTHKNGDSYLRYSVTSGVANRGVFVSDGSTFTRTTDPIYVYKALADIVFICQLKAPDGITPLYGAEADYGITSTMETAHIMSAIIDRLRVGDLEIFGTLKSPLMDTVNPQTGETINAPTPTYWPGSSLITLCASLADGWHAVDSASTLDSKNITHAVKGGSDNTVSYQASDAEVISDTAYPKTITSAVKGKITLYLDFMAPSGMVSPRVEKNGVTVTYFTWVTSYTTLSTTFNVDIGDVITVNNLYGRVAYYKNFRICPAVNTIGLWNNTDNTALSVDNAGYYDEAGTVNVNSGTLTTASIDDYWLGSELITLFTGKVSAYRTIALGGGTFNSKTCDEIYYTPTYLKITYTDTTSSDIYSDSAYNYTGSIVLDDVEGKILIGDESTEGQYELWSHNIPGSTDNILTVRNTKSGKVFSIWETRAPDTTAGNDSESTFSLHGVVGSDDYVHDHSMHNYSGDMHFIDGFYNYGGDHVGNWKQVAKRTFAAWQPSTAYVIDDVVSNGGNLYINVGAGISASSGGPTGTTAYINDNWTRWDYLCAASSTTWEFLCSEMESNSGRIWHAGGIKPTGYLYGTKTEAEIFTTLAACVRHESSGTGSKILLSGSVYTSSASTPALYIISFGIRSGSLFLLYGQKVSDGSVSELQAQQTDTSTSWNVCLAW